MNNQDAAFLLLGSVDDPCCSSVYAALLADGHAAHIIENPMVHPARFSWRLDAEQSNSRLSWAGNDLESERIAGVLVRGGGWIDPTAWQPADLAYMQAETHAGLIAWLASLSCPVINRYEAGLWYRPRLAIGSWRRWLRLVGLETPTTLVSNVPAEMVSFRNRAAGDGMPGVILRPLTSDARYLVATDDDWARVATLQDRMPVCLTYPHAEPHMVCVVGDRVVWNGTPPHQARAVEDSLRRFSSMVRLDFVELVLARIGHVLGVVSVEHFPRFELFEASAQAQIVAGLVQLMVESPRP